MEYFCGIAFFMIMFFLFVCFWFFLNIVDMPLLPDLQRFQVCRSEFVFLFFFNSQNKQWSHCLQQFTITFYYFLLGILLQSLFQIVLLTNGVLRGSQVANVSFFLHPGGWYYCTWFRFNYRYRSAYSLTKQTRKWQTFYAAIFNTSAFSKPFIERQNRHKKFYHKAQATNLKI